MTVSLKFNPRFSQEPLDHYQTFFALCNRLTFVYAKSKNGNDDLNLKTKTKEQKNKSLEILQLLDDQPVTTPIIYKDEEWFLQNIWINKKKVLLKKVF